MERKGCFTRIVGFILIVGILFAIGCSNKKRLPSDVTNSEFSRYIGAYTTGVISKNSTIKVQLTSAIAQSAKAKGDLPKDILEIEPSIEGKISWLDEQTIEFKPAKQLPQNTKYTAVLKLNKLVDNIDEKYKEFIFVFQTIKQNFEVNIDEMKTTDKKTLKIQKAIGTLKTADDETVDNVKKILIAKQEGKDLVINFVQGNPREFLFTIDNINRGDAASELLLKWDGDAIGADQKGESKTEIPSLKDFKFLSYKVVQTPDQYLQLQFSDPLQENQNLEGLIRIANVQGNPSCVIEDNTIKIYPPSRLSGNFIISVDQSIKNVLGYKLKNALSLEVSFEEMKPAVRLVNKGVILPDNTKGMVFPFEAVNLSSVDVRVIKVYENNVAQFLQVNNLDGENEMKRVGRPVVQKTISLRNSNVVDFNRWNRFYLDLNDLIKKEEGAIYRIYLSFRPQHSLYSCDSTGLKDKEMDDWNRNWDTWTDYSYWDGADSYFDYSNYNWEQRDNPCNPSYYTTSRSVSQNIISSNIGMIAKRGNDGSVMVFVTDIRTTKPLSGVTVDAYSYQNQLITSSTTNAEGIANFTNTTNVIPYLLIAKQEKQRGYLKIADNVSLSMSGFDVSGEQIKKGLKGCIYGERGVWRPGDSLFVTFVLEETAAPLPENHPIIFELKNPMGKLQQRLVQSKNSSGFYTYRLKTNEDDITGNWTATVQAGGAVFTKTLKIETIKPNRLKINIDFGKEYLAEGQGITGKMNVKWLHGAVAKNLHTTIDASMKAVETTFPKYDDYVFDDATKQFYSEPKNVFDSEIDEDGNASLSPDLGETQNAPGKLNVTFLTKVFEEGGDFSIDQFSMPYYPYSSFVGIRLPKGDKARGMLLTDTTHTVDIVTLMPSGKEMKQAHQVELSFYKLEWKWWWDKSEYDLVNFSARSNLNLLKHQIVTTKDGKARWNIRVSYPDWGRYIVIAKDLTSGHSTSKVVYIDWPGWASREQKNHGEGAAMLAFTADKAKYNVGDKVTLTIPTPQAGRALITIENGTKVLENYWLETKAGQSSFTFTATKAMSPNIYVFVTLIQPHAQTVNDLPIRMYGVLPIAIENAETHLNPQIKMPDVIEAESKVNIVVSEKNNKEMTFTLAVVDEGLLDLTRFKTPDLWGAFNAREALGVKTWDIYDWVIGAYGGELERLLSVGGDDALMGKKNQKANRFPPVVKFFGPFHLSGGSKTISFQMPRYVGSVKTMLVAGNNGAFGSAEKATPVRKPLMILGTLPRVAGMNEKIKLPVTVFAMEKNINNVSIQVKTNDLVKVSGESTKSLNFSKIGEETVYFDLESKHLQGIAKVEIVATSGKEKATYEIELDVRNPNPRITNVTSKVLEANQTWKESFTPAGIGGTNKAVLEVSSIPSMNLEKRLQYLIQYPHGCVEQTTSSAFPQLYLNDLMEVPDKRKSEITQNIKTAIVKLSGFQTSTGGMSYWANGSDVSEWGTSYAGHFLVEAQKKGYNVSADLINKWRNYQKNKAQNWLDEGKSSQLMQAYRLYTLALAGFGEMGAMNRLLENTKLSTQAKWRLAAAYELVGKRSIAEKLTQGLNANIPDYNELGFTFGSDLRDKAMILETMSLMDKKQEAFGLLKQVAEELGKEDWYSTQTTAYALIAVSKYLNKNNIGSKLDFTCNANNGKMVQRVSDKAVTQIEIPIYGTQKANIEIKSNTNSVLFVRIISSGIPEVGDATDADNGMKMTIKYLKTDGTSVNPESIQQGTDFLAEVIIKNTTMFNYEQLALNQVFPSGWEIINTRLLDMESNSAKLSVPTYRDIRDDRVYTYFDMKPMEVKTFQVLLNASYAGRFYMPTVTVEAMYNAAINARRHGQWVEVVKK